MKKIFFVVFIFNIQNALAVDIGFNCLTQLSNLIKTTETLSAGEGAVLATSKVYWNNSSGVVQFLNADAFITDLTKTARADLFNKQLEELNNKNPQGPPTLFEKEGALLDAGFSAMRENFSPPAVAKFLAHYHESKSAKGYNLRLINENASTLFNALKNLRLSYLKPAVEFVFSRPDLKQEILNAISGKIVITVGTSHQDTLDSIQSAQNYLNLLQKQLDHLSDTSLAGVNHITDLPDHMNIAFGKSFDLASNLLIKAEILSATHPQLADAITYILHHHVVSSGQLLNKMFKWSFDKKDRSDFVVFPIKYIQYKYSVTNKQLASRISDHDFIIAREWLVQELTLSH